MLSSISATRRGVKPRDTSARMRVWRGGSMARNDMVLWACGPEAALSRLTPWELENRAESRNAALTSPWRDRAQNPSWSLR